MNILKLKVNGDKEFDLITYYPPRHNELDLSIQGDNYADIKNALKSIELIEIFRDDVLMGEYTTYDTYGDIRMIQNTFWEGHNTYTDGILVTLKKASLEKQVERLDQQINPVIDESTMTYAELREYRIKQITKAGSEDIYSGDDVTLTSGEVRHFSYSVNDQNNLESYLNLIAISPDRENLYIAYHGDDETCRQYGYKDIIAIYFALSLKKLRVYTYVNMLREYIQNASIDTVREAKYGMELPDFLQERMEAIVEGSMESIMKIIGQFIPEEEPVEPVEPVEPEDPTEPTDPDEPVIPDEPIDPVDPEDSGESDESEEPTNPEDLNESGSQDELNDPEGQDESNEPEGTTE